MRSPTLQFIIAGALVAAWAWMLGRPLLTNLFRRSRRDSVGHFRYQQAVLSRPAGYEDEAPSRWADRPRPLRAWRSQTIERRRLQTMLAFALATFFSMLMAIALRGVFVRLFLIMALCNVVHIGVAAAIGARELRRREREARARAATRIAAKTAEDGTSSVSRHRVDAEHQAAPRARSELETGDQAEARYVPYQEPSVLFPDPPPPSPERDELIDVGFDDEKFGTGEFDDEFFEPIPELMFEPLNLDASILQDGDNPKDRTLFGPAEEEAVVSSDLSDEFLEAVIGEGYLEAGDLFEADGEALDSFDVDEDAEPELDDEAEEPVPTFKAPPQQRPRMPKRNKARPIYIESQLDEEEEKRKAVGD